MSVEQIEKTLLELPRAERRRFLQWVYNHENELYDPQEDDEIDPEVKAEILRRRDEAIANPELLEPWDGTMERLKAQLNEIRRQKAQSH